MAGESGRALEGSWDCDGVKAGPRPSGEPVCGDLGRQTSWWHLRGPPALYSLHTLRFLEHDLVSQAAHGSGVCWRLMKERQLPPPE